MDWSFLSEQGLSMNCSARCCSTAELLAILLLFQSSVVLLSSTLQCKIVWQFD